MNAEYDASAYEKVIRFDPAPPSVRPRLNRVLRTCIGALISGSLLSKGRKVPPEIQEKWMFDDAIENDGAVVATPSRQFPPHPSPCPIQLVSAAILSAFGNERRRP